MMGSVKHHQTGHHQQEEDSLELSFSWHLNQVMVCHMVAFLHYTRLKLHMPETSSRASLLVCSGFCSLVCTETMHLAK
jgi:hypothetical protein